MSNLTVFAYWLLIASWQMGVPVLPVIIDDEVASWAWAATCMNCEPPRYEATTPLLEYGDHEFIKHVAYHEVCHWYLQHESDWNDDKQRSLNEFNANKCAVEFMGVTMQDILREDAKALEWDQAQK